MRTKITFYIFVVVWMFALLLFTAATADNPTTGTAPAPTQTIFPYTECHETETTDECLQRLGAITPTPNPYPMPERPGSEPAINTVTIGHVSRDKTPTPTPICEYYYFVPLSYRFNCNPLYPCVLPDGR